MFGILELSNARYIGDRKPEMRSGEGAKNNVSVCILRTIERFRETGDRNFEDERRELKLNREQTTNGRFGEPQYVAQRATHPRGDLGDTNILVRDMVGVLDGGVVYLEESTERHVNIGDRPCRFAKWKSIRDEASGSWEMA